MVASDEVAVEATQHPLTAETLEKQLGRLGGTFRSNKARVRLLTSSPTPDSCAHSAPRRRRRKESQSVETGDKFRDSSRRHLRDFDSGGNLVAESHASG